jgi:hypothetical protein
LSLGLAAFRNPLPQPAVISLKSLPVNLQYKFELGMFTVEARLDDSGIFLQRGPVSKQVHWDQVYGAALLRNIPDSHLDVHPKEFDERAAAMLGGPEALAKISALQDKFRAVAFGYRDERGRRQLLDFYFPVDDPRYLQEIAARVGSGWLGEVQDRHQAEKKLGTAPGFFKIAFVLIVLLVAVALVAVLGFFSALGPAFNFLSLQRMLLDLQDGEYSSFGIRLLTYLALFVFAFLIRRWLRNRMAERRARLASSRLLR